MTIDTSVFLANTKGYTGNELNSLLEWNKIVEDPKMPIFFQHDQELFNIVDVFKRTEAAANSVPTDIRLPGNDLKKEDMIILAMSCCEFAEEKDGCPYAHKHMLEFRNGSLMPMRDEESASLWGAHRDTHFCTTEKSELTEEDVHQGLRARRFLKHELICLDPSGSEEGDVTVEYGNIGYYYFPLGGEGDGSKIRGDGHAFHLEMWGHLVSRGYFFYKGFPHQSLSRNYHFVVHDAMGDISKVHGVGLIIVLPNTCSTIAFNNKYFSGCHHYQRNDNKPLLPPSMSHVELVSIRDIGYHEPRNPESANLTISNTQRWNLMFGKLVEYMKRTGFDKDSGKTFVVFHDNSDEAGEDGAHYLEVWWKRQIGWERFAHQRVISPNERRKLEDVGVCFDIAKVKKELAARAHDKATNTSDPNKAAGMMLARMKQNRNNAATGNSRKRRR